MARHPNPQGKGLVPVLQGLQRHWEAARIPPKHIDQVSLELFTSLFVLQGEIRFEPVPGKDYWLYRGERGWRLSLVGPAEWHGSTPGRFIGRCVLRRDRTWSLELDGAVAADPVFMALVERQRQALESRLAAAPALGGAMPGYEHRSDYHGRVMAAMLGRSLRRSMQLSGIAELTHDEAKGLLGFDKRGTN